MRLTRNAACVAGFALAFSRSAAAQEGYKDAPAPIPAILDAEPLPLVVVSPDRSSLLLLERRALPPIAEVAAPELRLAGERIDPKTNGPARDTSFRGLRIKALAGGKETRIAAPNDARIAFPRFSADASKVAFTVTGDDAIHLWVADTATGQARRVSEARLNGTTGPPCAWADLDHLVCKLVAAGRGPVPQPPAAPAGPVVQESSGRPAPNRTYQDLLQGPADEALFEHYFTSQIATVALDGSQRALGAPGIHTTARPSPDGRFLLVETVHRPWSYLVPLERFPRRVEVWDENGRLVRRVADVPLQEEVPVAFDAVPTGPRQPGWRSDAAATLAWVEATDGGNPSTAAERRDRLALLKAPFEGPPASLLEAEWRIGSVTWGRDDVALVRESWWKTRRTRTWAVAPAHPEQAPRVLFERSSEDRYADPGNPVTVASPQGTPVLLLTRDGRGAYLLGQGASPEGDRPFLDRMDLATGKKARLFRSEAPYYEEPVALLDPAGKRLVTRRESVLEPPNYCIRDLPKKMLVRLTDFPDPAPQLAGATKELVRYRRADGVDLSATLYLPPGYDKSKGPLPFLFWAYPQEFKTAAAAAQVVGSPHRFSRPNGSSHLFVLTQGYGVLDNPTMPIVGEGDREPNDTYVDQLVASARAAVDKVVEMGVADRGRIAIGGHSYGAFMTANLLAHSDLFRAGIARSGAYNRSLTPFGFQAEERTFWKARDTYVAMSPFTWADKINEPLLMIHGAADNNSGTFPIQSERMYAAMKGNGGKVRLVMLPAESHGYRARESVGHTLWEMVRWLDVQVKAPPR